MDEGGVDHAIRSGRSATQALQILKIASMHLDTSGDERLCARIRACEAEHLMAPAKELSNDRRTDKSRRSRYKHFHSSSLLTRKRFSNHFFAFLPKRLGSVWIKGVGTDSFA